MKKIGLVFVVTALGCGSSSSGGSGASVTLDQFPQTAATTICAQNFKCCDATELAGKTMSDCVNNTELVTGLLSGSISDSQTKGRATYNAQQMGTCLGAIGALSCTDWKSGKDPTNQASCATVITGKVANGGACSQAYECTSLNCAGVTSDANGNPVDGTCMPASATPLIAVGAACTGSSADCVSDAYCDAVSLTCKAKKAAGEACDPNGGGSECANSCDSTTSKCTCYVGCSVAAPVTTPGTLLSLALLGLAIGGARLSRRRRRR